MKILLKNFDIVTDFDSAPLSNACLSVSEDGCIERINPDGDLNETAADTVLDGEGKLLIPGFINGHTHLGMAVFRGFVDDVPLQEWLEDWIWPAEEHLEPREVYWSSLLAIIELLHSGVTTVADMYFYMNSTARSIKQTGIRGLISHGIIAQQLDEEGRKELDQAFNLADRWNGEAGGRISVALSPHAPYTCGPEVWKQIIQESERRGIPIHTHVAETSEEVQQSLNQYGRTPVERLDHLGVLNQPVIAAHCVHVNDRDIDLLQKNDVGVVHNPSSNMKLSSGAAPITELLNDGVTVGLGTDGPASNNDLDFFEEARLATFLQKLSTGKPTALDVPEVLRMTTKMGAEALGYKQLGAIQEGFHADLVAIDRNKPHWKPEHNSMSNLVYSAKGVDVDMVMVDGEVVLRDGEVESVDESEVFFHMEQIAKKYGKLKDEHLYS